jgi:hypothetical protein
MCVGTVAVMKPYLPVGTFSAINIFFPIFTFFKQKTSIEPVIFFPNLDLLDHAIPFV